MQTGRAGYFFETAADVDPTQPSFCKELKAASKASMQAATILHRPLMVYVGSSSITQPGFISLSQSQLDVTKAEDFLRWFCLGSVDVFLTEHTFEHVPEHLHETAFRLMHKYLKPGGRLRIAVPSYGSGHVASPLDIEYGHVTFPTRESLTRALVKAGFDKVLPLEYKDKNNTVTTMPYDSCDGRIRRSVRHDDRNRDWMKKNIAQLNLTVHNVPGMNIIGIHPPPVVSLILDAIKSV